MNPLRVLTVDDNPEVLEIFRKVVDREYPGSPIALRSPHIALEAITKTGMEFDVVFADLLMPRMSGEEFLSHVRELLPAAHRVLITGFSRLMATDLEEGLAHDVLMKPVRNEELLEILAKVDRRP